MNFGFTEEQEMLRGEVRKFLAERCPIDEVRRIIESPEGWSPALWKEMTELGWLGLLVPERFGGAGLGWVDLVVLLEESGRAHFPSPLLGSSLAVLAIVENASEEQQRSWLPGVVDGHHVYTPALLERGDRLAPEATELRADADADGFVLRGEKLFVTDAGAATHFVVSCRAGRADHALALARVEASAPGVRVRDLPSIDPSKRLAAVELDGVRIDAEAIFAGATVQAGAARAVARLYDHAAAAITAEVVGAAEAAHALIVEYAKTRVQFDSVIGRFQGIKHPLAEMYVDIESFKSLLYYAAWCLDEEPEEAPRHVSMAKAYANDAFTRIGIDCVELLGAIGYTWEHDAQLHLKRSKWAKSMYGSSDHHYERVAALGGL